MAKNITKELLEEEGWIFEGDITRETSRYTKLDHSLLFNKVTFRVRIAGPINYIDTNLETIEELKTLWELLKIN